MDHRDIHVTVNGQGYHASVPISWNLAEFLRNDLGLTGTHIGCDYGVCGACTILMDTKAIRACLTLAVQANSSSVITVEALSEGEALHSLQEAFRRYHALQCGFCTPGFLMSAIALLDENGSLDEQRVREELSGNLCRCTGYTGIVSAVLEAARSKLESRSAKDIIVGEEDSSP